MATTHIKLKDIDKQVAATYMENKNVICIYNDKKEKSNSYEAILNTEIVNNNHEANGHGKLELYISGYGADKDEAIKDLDIVSILDGFSGSTRVSQAFAKSGYIVTSNDISIWSKVFATAYLLNKQRPSYYNEMIEHLNNVVPYYGWFSKHYGGREDEVKLPFK